LGVKGGNRKKKRRCYSPFPVRRGKGSVSFKKKEKGKRKEGGEKARATRVTSAAIIYLVKKRGREKERMEKGGGEKGISWTIHLWRQGEGKERGRESKRGRRRGKKKGKGKSNSHLPGLPGEGRDTATAKRKEKGKKGGKGYS